MQAELLKLKNNPLALFLLALGPLCVGLVFALQGSPAVTIELSTDIRELWSVPMHLVVVLFLPYLLTLDKQLGTEKWLWTTPIRPWKQIAQKWALSMLLAILIGAVSMLMIWGHFDVTMFLNQLVIALSTSVTFTALSLLLGSFVAVFVVSLVWSTIAGYLVLLLPPELRGPLNAALPGLELANFSSGEFQEVRIMAHVFLLSLIAVLIRQKGPRW